MESSRWFSVDVVSLDVLSVKLSGDGWVWGRMIERGGKPLVGFSYLTLGRKGLRLFIE